MRPVLSAVRSASRRLAGLLPRRLAVLAVLALLSVLAACGAFSMVEPKRQDFGAFAVTAPVAWNKATVSGRPYWTADGPFLDYLLFFDGIANGKRVIDAPDDKTGKDSLVFRSTMDAIEVSELVRRVLTALNQTQVEVTNLRPERFGSANGFAFDLTAVSEKGLSKAGRVIGTTAGGKLNMIVFVAAKLNYFDRHVRNVERLFRSVEFKA